MRFREHTGLILILVLFLISAAGFVQNVPYRTGGKLLNQGGAVVADIGAPDERQHANYIGYVRENRAIPRFFYEGQTDFAEMYQAHQPPLYYVLAATMGDPRSESGQGTRWLSVLFGLATVVGLYRIGFGLTGGWVGGVAVAMWSLLPGFVMLFGAISNDPLLICLVTWSVERALASGSDERMSVLVTAGICAGLAMLTKSSALALLVALGLVAIFHPRRRDAILWIGILPLVIALPWLIRNSMMYGDPLILGAFARAFSNSPQASMFIGQLGAMTYWTEWVGWWTARSVVGVFGYMDVFMQDSAYRLMLALIAVATLGNLVKYSSRAASPEAPAISLAKWQRVLLWTLFGVTLLSFIRFNSIYFQAQARYLFPAFASMAVCLGAGFLSLPLRDSVRKWMVIGLALVLGCVSIYVAFAWLPGEFARRVV